MDRNGSEPAQYTWSFVRERGVYRKTCPLFALFTRHVSNVNPCGREAIAWTIRGMSAMTGILPPSCAREAPSWFVGA